MYLQVINSNNNKKDSEIPFPEFFVHSRGYHQNNSKALEILCLCDSTWKFWVQGIYQRQHGEDIAKKKMLKMRLLKQVRQQGYSLPTNMGPSEYIYRKRNEGNCNNIVKTARTKFIQLPKSIIFSGLTSSFQAHQITQYIQLLYKRLKNWKLESPQ